MAAAAVQWARLESLGDAASTLPVIGHNPAATVMRDARLLVGSTYTSLPPLPKYQHSDQPTCRWGEDDAIERLGFQATSSGYARLRHNFDSCHPVPDVTAAKYEGYMFPKAMHEDISVFRMPEMNVSRHVPRDSGCELFPTNDPQRVTAGGYVLGEPSRAALARYVKHLYRTSGYSATFQDTAEFMKRRMNRKTQFDREHPKSNEIPTCSRILNHSDPCPLCWAGDVHTAYEHDLAYIQSQLCDCPKRNSYGCEADTARQEQIHGADQMKKAGVCVRSLKRAGWQDCTVEGNDTSEYILGDNISKDVKLLKGQDSRFKTKQDAAHWTNGIMNGGEQVSSSRNVNLLGTGGAATLDVRETQEENQESPITSCGDQKQASNESNPTSDESRDKATTQTGTCVGAPGRPTQPCVAERQGGSGEAEFGPWAATFNLPEKSEEDVLVPYVYRHRLPAPFHFWPTENELVSSSEERHRHNPQWNVSNGQYYGPWAAMNRVMAGLPPMTSQARGPEKQQEPGSPDGEGVPLPPVTYPNNHWTYRDQDNLRIPCIAHVIGSTHKTDAHKRYETIGYLKRTKQLYHRQYNFGRFHRDHPEATPDLRDFRRYSKRVTFYGYNSSVYR